MLTAHNCFAAESLASVRCRTSEGDCYTLGIDTRSIVAVYPFCYMLLRVCIVGLSTLCIRTIFSLLDTK